MTTQLMTHNNYTIAGASTQCVSPPPPPLLLCCRPNTSLRFMVSLLGKTHATQLVCVTSCATLQVSCVSTPPQLVRSRFVFRLFPYCQLRSVAFQLHYQLQRMCCITSCDPMRRSLPASSYIAALPVASSCIPGICQCN